ncbi:MAG TPA: AAA family ATPase [Rhodothermales bacterium]|nr:AAA family ATPase [Rhodothermales bacterium]
MRAWLWAVSPDLYPAFVGAGTLALERTGRRSLYEIAPGDTVFVYLTEVQTIAGMFEAVGRAFEDATVLAPGQHLPHRLRVRPTGLLAEETRLPAAALAGHLTLYESPEGWRRTVARVITEVPATDARVLAFLIRAREAGSVERALDVYEQLEALRAVPEPPAVSEPAPAYGAAPFAHGEAAEALLTALDASGFIYAPWQVAAYLTALRTRPFVLLAGPTGTGKTRLPLLVAEATGATATLLPVRPDWTDSSDTLGYTDLSGRFRPGAVLLAAREAARTPERPHVLVLDEMNLARPEHYLAEVLSRTETRRTTGETPPLLPEAPDPAFAGVGLPPTLALVGTVNVDESTHAFARKVLDRAFVLELGEADLRAWTTETHPLRLSPWPAAAFAPRARTLGGLGPLSDDERAMITRAVETIAAADGALGGGTLGYRTRDDVALFCLHARDVPGTFRTRKGTRVDPLDVALTARVLPRLAGGRAALGPSLRALLTLMLGPNVAPEGLPSDREAARVLDAWRDAGRPAAYPDAAFPRTAARLARMLERLATDGFTSFWA